MRLKHLFLPLLLIAAPSSAWAESAQKMTSLEAALTECATKVKKDKEGMPDQKEMLKCMERKGFGDPTGSTKPATATSR